MGDYVPKERSLILHLSHVTLMPHLQVSFLHADPQNDQLKFWHIPYVTYFQLSDQIGLDKVIVISQKSFFLKKKFIFLLSGSFTTNVVAAAPVLYCKKTLDISKTVREC